MSTTVWPWYKTRHTCSAFPSFEQGQLGLSPRATLLVAAMIVLWVSGLLSALVDNIPYTAVTIPLVATLLAQLDAGTEGQILWWALALGACLGGNGTLIGASANVTVTGLAEKDGKRISFNEFTAFGAGVTAITLVMSSVYLSLWLYVGATSVNVVGAVVLVLIFAATWYSSKRSPLNCGASTPSLCLFREGIRAKVNL
ncbi:MAG: hypothetical protein GEV13_33690 [Rhodospirillales bacterium]|nr:hypothetical protein [Rhodospirillales bacterium]